LELLKHVYKFKTLPDNSLLAFSHASACRFIAPASLKRLLLVLYRPHPWGRMCTDEVHYRAGFAKLAVPFTGYCALAQSYFIITPAEKTRVQPEDMWVSA
jgi:hypothetical protein